MNVELAVERKANRFLFVLLTIVCLLLGVALPNIFALEANLAESATAPPRLVDGRWLDEIAPPRLVMNWGFGKTQAEYDLTAAFCREIGCNAFLYPLPGVARMRRALGDSEWYGIQMGTDASADALRAFVADNGIADPRFRLALLYEEIPQGVHCNLVLETIRRRTPWLLVADGPLGYLGQNVSRMARADIVFSQYNVHNLSFAEDMRWYVALHESLLPGKRFGISPQLVGSGNVLGDAAETAAAIMLLAGRTDILPLWGAAYAAQQNPSPEWISAVSAAIRYWQDYRPGDEAAKPPIDIKRGNTVWWDQAKFRICLLAGFEPRFGPVTDPRLDALLPLGPDTAAGQIHWRLISNKFQHGLATKSDVRAAEMALAQTLKGVTQ